MLLKRVAQKIRRDGLKGLAKSVGRWIQGRYLGTPYGEEVVAPVLEDIIQRKGSVMLVQVGANIGATDSDPIHKFIVRHFTRTGNSATARNRAILIEPVKYLYDQLAANYAGYDGVHCVNAAVAEVSGSKFFYRFRDGIDPAAHGLPWFAHQLGSFDREFILGNCPPFSDPAAREAFIRENVVESEVPCVTLHDLFEREKVGEVDMLVVDTEGYDYEILKTLDFSRMAPAYINYERSHLRKDQAACRRLLVRNGYALYDHADDTFCTRGKSVGPIARLRESIYDAWLDAIY
jgi:FkbM family methyltransferase